MDRYQWFYAFCIRRKPVVRKYKCFHSGGLPFRNGYGYRNHFVTFSLDIVDRSPVSNFSVELYTNTSNTITGATLKKTFASSELANGTTIRYTQAFPTGTTYFFYKLVKASTEIAKVKVDNLKFGKSVSRYKAVVVMKADYYPFGMTMEGRTYNIGDYRYGYNGMEQDPELKGNGNSYTTEFRQYDPRLGRWLSLDPMMSSFPWMSPYVAFDNNPIFFNDPYGLSAGPGGPPEITGNEKEGDVSQDGNYVFFDGKWGSGSAGVEIKSWKLPYQIAKGDNPIWSGDDLEYGTDCTENIEHDLGFDDCEKSYIDTYEKLSDEQLFYELKGLAEDFSIGSDSEKMTTDMVKHFQENTGTAYTSDLLKSYVQSNFSTKRWIKNVKKYFQESISETPFKTDGSFSEIMDGKVVDRPMFTKKYIGNIINGLTFCINDVWTYTITVTDYKEVEGKYTAVLSITLYDHFGLDLPDIDVHEHPYSSRYPSFFAWYILQHNRGYKPFVTYINLDPITISGKIK